MENLRGMDERNDVFGGVGTISINSRRFTIG
jgi:hypothetical protein